MLEHTVLEDVLQAENKNRNEDRLKIPLSKSLESDLFQIVEYLQMDTGIFTGWYQSLYTKSTYFIYTLLT